MKAVEWEFASDAETEKFRKKPKARGRYKPGSSQQGVYQIVEPSTVKDRDGSLHQVAVGESIKVFDDAEARRYESEDWLMFAERVRVRYGEGVESLRAGARLAVLPDLESPK